MTAILIGVALLAVIGVKYYTAVGQRNLERRLMRTRKDLDDARQALKDAKAKGAEVRAEEELAVMRLQYMKEKIEDLKIQLTTSDEQEGIVIKDETPRPAPAASPPPANIFR